MAKTKIGGAPHHPMPGKDWRENVFRYRGMLLLPVALVLVIFGRPSLLSAELGIAIALLGECLRIWAVGYSGETTRSGAMAAPQLITTGPYALVRNPLYVGNAMIAIGFTIAFSGGIPTGQAFWMLVFVLALVIGVYSSIVPLEEAFLARTFGMKYTEYTTLVPRAIPWKGPLDKAKQQGTWQRNVIWNAEIITLMFFALMVVAVVLKLGTLGHYTAII